MKAKKNLRAFGAFGLSSVLALIAMGAIAHAAEEVGSVAALEGTAEVRHVDGTQWISLKPGAAVLLGDRVRTLKDSKLKLLFRDDTVMTLAANTELTVDENVAPEKEAARSYFSLVVGTVRSMVSERYGTPGSQFKLGTPTAVAGVRGTRFIAAHDEDDDETVVVGLSHTTLVRSTMDTSGEREVALKAGEMTRVARGSFPVEPVKAPDDVLKSLTGATGFAASAGAGSPTTAASTAKESAADQQLREQNVQRDLTGASPLGGRPAPPPPNK